MFNILGPLPYLKISMFFCLGCNAWSSNEDSSADEQNMVISDSSDDSSSSSDSDKTCPIVVPAAQTESVHCQRATFPKALVATPEKSLASQTVIPPRKVCKSVNYAAPVGSSPTQKIGIKNVM